MAVVEMNYWTHELEVEYQPGAGLSGQLVTVGCSCGWRWNGSIVTRALVRDVDAKEIWVLEHVLRDH